jgi:hypothetical protein
MGISYDAVSIGPIMDTEDVTDAELLDPPPVYTERAEDDPATGAASFEGLRTIVHLL